MEAIKNNFSSKFSSSLSHTSTERKKNKPFLFLFKYWSWIVLALCAFFQCLLLPKFDNFMAVTTVVIAWSILANFFLSAPIIYNYPLSTFLVIGFVSTQFYFPLLFTVLEGKPIIFNLKLPNEVFLHSILELIAITISHLIYRSYLKRQTNRLRFFLKKGLFFNAPSEIQLWIMGFIGLAAMFYVYVFAKTALQSTGGALDKFIESLSIFAYAPYFIGLGILYGNSNVKLRKIVLKLVLFSILIFLVSVARNSRGAFMIGIASLGFAYGLGVLVNLIPPKLFSLKNSFISLIIFWLLTGPIADLGTAMVIVRGQRIQSSSELVISTLKAFEDKSTIQSYQLQSRLAESFSWDEYYLNNIFLARFSNIKFNDASLIEASKFNGIDEDFQKFNFNRILAILPSPLLKLLGFNLDKNQINFSFGDYLHSRANLEGYNGIGANRTGHISGTGMAAFGWWYLLILAIGMIPVYLLIDALCLKIKSPTAGLVLRFSFCGILALTTIFNFLPSESVMNVFMFLIRGWLQMVILYYLIFRFTIPLSKFKI